MSKSVTVNAKNLLHALQVLGRTVDNKSTLPILGHVLIEGKPMADPQEGIDLFLHATDLDTYAVGRISAHGDVMPKIAVDHKTMTAIIKKAQGDVQLTVGKKNEFAVNYTVYGQNIEAPLPSLPSDEFVPEPTNNGEEIALPPQFGKMYRRSLPFRSHDETRYILNGVCIDNREGRGHMIATDGRRLYAASGFSGCVKAGAKETQEAAIIIPAACDILEANGMLDREDWTLTVEWKGHADPKNDETFQVGMLKTKDWRIHFKPHQGNYPRWTQVVPTSVKTTIKLDDTQSEQLLKVIGALPEWTNGGRLEPTVRVHVEDGKVTIKSLTAVEKLASAKIDGLKVESSEDVAVEFNRAFFLDALRLKLPQIGIQSDLEPGMFKSDTELLVLMPMRMS